MHRIEIGLYLNIKETTPIVTAQIVANLHNKGLLKYAVLGSFRPDMVAEIKANASDAVTSILFSSPHIDPVALATAVRADYAHQ